MFLATGCHVSDGTLARLGAAVEAAIPAGPIILVAPVNAGDDLVAGERLAVDRLWLTSDQSLLAAGSLLRTTVGVGAGLIAAIIDSYAGSDGAEGLAGIDLSPPE